MPLPTFLRRMMLWPRRRLASLAALSKMPPACSPCALLPKVLVFVEGQCDIEFLRRISTMLHAEDPKLPNLAEMERKRELIFLPIGGSDSRPWTFRLASLGCPEFHLYDRDVPPATQLRQQAADIVNARPNCCALLTRKRSLENYLDSSSIFEACGIRVQFSADDNVADLVAQHLYQRQEGHLFWQSLPARNRKRRRNHAKESLNTQAADRMTPERLASQDPDGEVRSWLTTIANLASRRP